MYDEIKGINGPFGSTEVENNSFKVYGPPGKFHWTVFGKRNSIETEPLKESVIVKGKGPYLYI
jgi:hypothetical protein